MSTKPKTPRKTKAQKIDELNVNALAKELEPQVSHSLRADRLQEAIFRPKDPQNQRPVEDDTEYLVFYTMVGTNESRKSTEGNYLLQEENDKTYAKKLIRGSKEFYFVKINRVGHCFDPLGMYEIGSSSATKARTQDKNFQFKQVNEKVFHFYLEFLKSKNNAYLLNAQRSMF